MTGFRRFHLHMLMVLIPGICMVGCGGGREPMDTGAPEVYSFVDRLPYALELSGLGEVAGPAAELNEVGHNGWDQPANSQVAWRIVVPRGGWLRVQPAWEARSAVTCRILLHIGGKRMPLAEFSQPPDEPMLYSLARWGGKRGLLEFVTEGPVSAQWSLAAVGGHIRPADTSLFLFTIDTLRADHVGAYGYQLPVTPTLDALCAAGTRFERAFTPANKSLPSHATIMTGRYPQSHGLLRNSGRINRQQISLADLLAGRGYPTAAYVNWQLLAMKKTTARGFEKRRYLDGTPGQLELRGRENVYANALRWVEATWEQPFFLWVHSQFLHMDGVPEDYAGSFAHGQDPAHLTALARRVNREGIYPIFAERREAAQGVTPEHCRDLVALYDVNLRYTDDFIAGFLEGLKPLGLDPFAAVMVTSDHGTCFGEHGMLGHIGPPVDELQHVPLILVLPGTGQAPGGVAEGLAETTDIAPTVLSYLGLRIPRRMQGRDLMPVILGEQPTVREYVFSATNQGKTEWHGVRSRDWLHFRDSREGEVWLPVGKGADALDVPARPGHDVRVRQRESLTAWLGRTPVVRQDETPVSDEIRAMLIKSGYLDDAEAARRRSPEEKPTKVNREN